MSLHGLKFVASLSVLEAKPRTDQSDWSGTGVTVVSIQKAEFYAKVVGGRYDLSWQ